MLNEEDIRRIVREELKLAFETMANMTDLHDGYDTDHIESVALSAIGKVAESAASMTDHATDCEEREGSWAKRCTCGTRERERAEYHAQQSAKYKAAEGERRARLNAAGDQS